LADHQTRKYAIGFTTLLTLFLLLSAVAFSPVQAVTSHPADAMWIDPDVVSYSSSTPVGTKFNITVMLNVTTPAMFWQFFLIYNSTHLKALRCAYTGNGKSQWSGSATVDTVSPAFDQKNATNSYVLFGETLRNGANKTGEGSLAWIEFNITLVPAEGVSITSELRLDNRMGAFKSKVQDSSFTPIAITYGKCDYFIPEFPLTISLIAFFVLTSTAVLIFKRASRRKNNRQSCKS
jgi:hypothetical protein